MASLAFLVNPVQKAVLEIRVKEEGLVGTDGMVEEDLKVTPDHQAFLGLQADQEGRE